MARVQIEAHDILKLLPYQYPFLLIDRVTELEPGLRGAGIKNVTFNEPYLQGHFPGRPVLPGVLIVDACGQLTAVVCASVGVFDGAGTRIAEAAPAPSIEYLAAIDRFKFLQPVVPGDQLRLETTVAKRWEGLLYANVRALVNGTVVAEGNLTVTASGRGAR